MTGTPTLNAQDFPQILWMGVTGLLVRFGDTMSARANSAALAFAADVQARPIAQVEESAPSLVSVFLRFDPVTCDTAQLRAEVEARLVTRDWFANAETATRVWHIPVAFDGPDLTSVAHETGLSETALTEQITAQTVRVLTLGFAPGQPYLGLLSEACDVPRRQGIAPNVPKGALVTAVRQLIIFANDTPTGWHHIGTAAFECFKADRSEPIVFQPGDAVRFHRAAPDEIASLRGAPDGLGGARLEALT